MRRIFRTITLGLVAASLVIAAAVLGIGVGASDAQTTQVTCPQGTTLAADGESCLTDAVDDNVTTTTSCLQGVLSDDGTRCIIPRLDAAPAPATGATPSGDLTAPVPKFTG